MDSKSSKLSQKDYLKKYLSGRDGKKKKKKAKPSTTSSSSFRTKIIDDDIDVSQMQPLDSSEIEIEIYDTAEDAPQVAGIIDERPAELRAKEQYGNQKWKVLTDPIMGDVQGVVETGSVEKRSELKARDKHGKSTNDEDDKWGKLAKRLEEEREEQSDEESRKGKRHKHKKHKSKESSKKKKTSSDDEMYDKNAVQNEMDREREELLAKEEEHNKHLEKYYQWGKGVKQLEDRRERILEQQHEMEKPLARYADDEDLDQHLRDQEREGDPMLEYLRGKKAKEKPDAKPRYQGPYPPNRYNIRPGHRWDGVDRSCGYEKKWFENQNARKAVEEEAYKWGSADL